MELLAGLLENSVLPFSIGYLDGRVGLFNDAFCRLLGYTRKELQKRTWAEDLTPPEWRELTMRNLAKLRRTNRAVRYEKEYLRRDGTRAPVEVCVQMERDAAGKPLFYFGFVTDLTDRNRTQEALRKSETLWRSAFKDAPSGMSLTGVGGGFKKVNRALCAMLGYSEKELLRMTVGDVSHPDDLIFSNKLANECLEGSRKIVEMEKRYLHKTGKLVWGSVRGVPLRNSPDKSILFMTHLQDITKRKQAEAALQLAHDELEQKVKERTIQLRSLALELTRAEQRERRRVAYVLHEDLLQDLAAAKIQLEGIRRDVSPADVQAVANKISLILNDAIAVSRSLTMELYPPVLRELSLSSALRWLADHMQAKFSLTVSVEDGNDAELTSDELRVFLFHAVREALFNVVKHAGITKARVRITHPSSGQITVEVQDKGKGFNPAISTVEGFGLFSIRERASLLGGEVKVTSKPGKGTCLTLTVPAS